MTTFFIEECSIRSNLGSMINPIIFFYEKFNITIFGFMLKVLPISSLRVGQLSVMECTKDRSHTSFESMKENKKSFNILLIKKTSFVKREDKQNTISCFKNQRPIKIEPIGSST